MRFFLAILIFATKAQAACPSLQSLEDPNGNCMTNGSYVDAGISCFLAFEKLVKAKAGIAGSEMGKSNKKFVMGKSNSQKSNLKGASADFKIAAATLADLGVAAPITAVAQQEISARMTTGAGEEDYSGMAKVILGLAGVE